MKIFQEFPQDGPQQCPICGTMDNKPCILVPILGTERGNNMEAAVVHADCLRDNLFYYENHRTIAAFADFPYKKS